MLKKQKFHLSEPLDFSSGLSEIQVVDNEIDTKTDVSAILFLLVQNRQQTHDSEPCLDQALMDSAYRSEKKPKKDWLQKFRPRGWNSFDGPWK